MRPGSVNRTHKMIRKTVYALKRRFGAAVDIYLEDAQGFDPATGDSVVTYTKYRIRRAVVFPGLVHRDIFYSITFLRANSNFAYGGDIQNDDRQLLVDAKDLPKGFQLTDKHYFVYNRQRWDLQDFTVLEDGVTYFINMRRSRNAPTIEILEETITQTLTATQGFDLTPTYIEASSGEALLTESNLPLEQGFGNA